MDEHGQQVLIQVMWLLIYTDKMEYKNVSELLQTDMGTEGQLLIPRKIEVLVEQREHLRQTKQWAEADEIRHQIEKLGYKVEDRDSGPEITD